MRYDSTLPPCCGDDRSLQEIYDSKKGVCRHAAYFTLHTLERGAIPAALLAINFQQGGNKWHAITVEKKSDGFWDVMNFVPNGAQPMRGPFTSHEKVVKTLIQSWNKATLIAWNVEATNNV
jgi:hypothetical protein